MITGFQIDGGWFTGYVRNVWAEKATDRAIRLLDAAFPKMDEATKIAICTGKKKLVGINTCALEDDDATTDDRGMPLLTPLQLIDAERVEKQEIADRLDDNIGPAEEIPSPWGRLRVPRRLTVTRHGVTGVKRHLDMSWDDFEKKYPERVAEAKANTIEMKELREATRASKKEVKRYQDALEKSPFAGLADMLGGGNPTLTAAANAILAPPLTEPPPPDTKLEAKNGWISPEGKLYPCDFMGHLRLADALGKTEAQLEKSWVKLQDSQDTRAIVKRTAGDFPHIPDRGVTQAQFNTIEKWCTKHGRELPDVDVR